MRPPPTCRTEESLRAAARRTSRLRRVRHEVIEGLNKIHSRSGWSGCRSPPPLPRLPQAQTRVHALRGPQARCLTRHQTRKRQTARQLLASRRRPRCSQRVGNDPPSLEAATLDDACVGSSSGATSTITSRRTTAPVTSQSPTRRLRTQLSARALHLSPRLASHRSLNSSRHRSKMKAIRGSPGADSSILSIKAARALSKRPSS